MKDSNGVNRWRQFQKSFSYALRGLAYVLRYEKNFQAEVVMAVLVIVAMIYFQVTRAESIVLTLVIMGVMVMELLNTVVERVVDILKPRIHPYARLIKDLMAAGVLISAIAAAIIGVLIFLPYVLEI
jgi:undecaprenol kinase